ncbi:ABC transporter ATP-binding protein [Halopelagius longus]|uniref:ABC-type D-xylose/L-arabinose transporter n=1 Tax=Halopelagius longus TaxID=1236180 RepID=A0A1H1G6N7_9EURY|nr:ABC transporter ATP-binding protein [Halopelagius longus]RDI69824.1 ABC transporter ATP-binding protein [Halopelagius longus]SDR08588.1 multiple sugar transport system ATP-binding protein [Halopelagius longus]
MATIDITNLRKEFGDDGNRIVAVEDLDLTIEDGEFIVFVGPSGCGKTTTLRCIAGLEDVTDGRIEFDEHDVTDQRARERNVAMVFQNYALYPHMTVRKNIGFPLRLSTKQSSDEIDRQVEDVAELLGIEELLDDKPKELSGGQQQRVALGRAIIRDPEVFLMDEPLSNLDAKLRSVMRTELQELQQELGVTTAYVTHDQVEAMAMGDRIAILDEGKLQQVGTANEVYRSPANEFVAGFIGSPSINLFTAEVNGDTLVGPGGFTYTLEDGSPVADRDRVRVGVRPEDMDPVSNGCMPSEVTVVEHMGNENFLYAEMGDVALTARVESEIRPEEGTVVSFDFAEEDLYLFDADTQEALKTKTSETEVDYDQYVTRNSV